MRLTEFEQMGTSTQHDISGLGTNFNSYPSPCPRCAGIKPITLKVADTREKRSGPASQGVDSNARFRNEIDRFSNKKGVIVDISAPVLARGDVGRGRRLPARRS